MKLKGTYKTTSLMLLLNRRYGLFPCGIKQILRISTGRYNLLVKGGAELTQEEGDLLTSAFPELDGRFEIEGE